MNAFSRLLTTACLLMGSMLMNAEEVTALQIFLANGNTVTCSFAEKPVMTLLEGKLSLTTSEANVGDWEFAEVKSWSFIKMEVDGIEETASEKQIVITDEAIFMGSKKGMAYVYDISGQMVATINLDSTSQISLAPFSTGTYILKADDVTVKFLKK